MTDEQREEALEITHKKVEVKDRPPLNLLSLVAVMDGDKAIRSEEYRVLYEFLRFALEPKAVTRESLSRLISILDVRDKAGQIFIYDFLADNGIAVKEE